jgi:hypothetical protein
MQAQFSRRDLLKAAGSTLLVPGLVSQALAAPVQLPPRLFLLMQTNGTHQPRFWPDAGFTSPILEPLLGDPKLRAKTTVIKGLNNTSGGVGNEHDRGFCGLYSGYRTVGKGEPVGGGVSIDQFLRSNIPLPVPHPALHCGVFNSYQAYNASRFSFSHLGAGQPVPCELDLVRLYERVFGGQTAIADEAAARAAAERRLRQKQSILDAVAADVTALARRLGPEQRRKLDVHLTSVRESEARLGAMVMTEPGSPSPLAAHCRGGQAPAGGLEGDANVPTRNRLMLELLGLAATCNLTRIVGFQFGKGGEHFRYEWLNIGIDGHDEIAHEDNGVKKSVTEQSIQINRWYAEQVVALARALDAIPEGNGTVLDNSLIVWGNELAIGPHGLENIPIVLIGSAGGRIKRTGYLVDAGPQDYHRLGATLLNIMGHPATGFGEEPSCGVLAGLEIVA